MKPFIEVMKDMVVIETEGMVITVHVSAPLNRHVRAEGREQRAEGTSAPLSDPAPASDPGCGLIYKRRAVVEPKPYPVAEAEKELHQAIDEYVVSAPLNKPKRVYKDKECVVCGRIYTPVGTTQKFCSAACKARSKGNKLSEMEERELEKTLADIEERRKRTYEVSR
jgi:hypothetical protein